MGPVEGEWRQVKTIPVGLHPSGMIASRDGSFLYVANANSDTVSVIRTDTEEVIERIANTLAAGGTLVVVEWDWEQFDEPTADWCFQRLGPDEGAGWLHRRRDEWLASGQPWSAYVRKWAEEEQLHSADTLLRLLDTRFHREHLAYGPYLFPDLARTTEGDEQAAIEAGQIRATRVDYVGRPR